MRRAKIVCTLGPASDTLRTVEDLVAAGMSVARINASHTEPDEIIDIARTVRDVDERVDPPVSTILDLQGPEIRTLPSEESVSLEVGATVALVPHEPTGSDVIGLSRTIAAVVPGDRVLIDDGLIECVVEEVTDETVHVRVESGGPLGDRRGVNIPGVDLDLPMVTDKDRADLDVLDTETVDFVGASFVRDAEDILEVNAAIEARDCDHPIIAKIERADAVENLQGIIEEAYGIMVARGDLGVECPMEDVPMMQKRIIHRCHEAGVPVITATEMLDSMVTAHRPTRAEASDVANAVLDGTDAVMLSEETAVGDHPVRVVETMDRIVGEVERSREYATLLEQRIPEATESRADALARAGRFLARDIGASALIVTTESGYTALKAAKYRPSVPIVAATVDRAVYYQLAVSWGIRPYLISPAEPTATEVIEEAVGITTDEGIAESGDAVVVLTGMMQEIKGAEFSNSLKVHVAAETLATGRVVVAGRVAGQLYRTSDGDLSDLESGAILTLGPEFDGEFTGNLQAIGGIVSAEEGLTGYAAMIARELELPMISSAVVPAEVPAGTVVTLDAERGILYDGDIATPSIADDRSRPV